MSWSKKQIEMAKFIDSQRTEKGGWTKDTLRRFGVMWPPPKGWRQALIDSDWKPEFESK